jgi:hypothetical protein
MAVVKKVRGGDSHSLRGNSQGNALTRARTPTLKLPSKPNQPPSSLADYIIFLYGDKGVGKSSLAAEFSNSITFMTEPLRRNLPILQIPDPNEGEPPLTWERMLAYQNLILNSGKYKTVIFDTADRSYQLCMDYTCREAGCKHPNDKKDYGATWNALKVAYESFIIEFAQAGMTVVALSHARRRAVTTLTGEEWEEVTPTCPDACWTIWKAISDFAFYYGYHRRERTIYLRGDDEIWASCGTSEKHFLNSSGEPLAYISVGDSPRKAYQTLMDSFQNKVEGEVYVPWREEEEDEEPVKLPQHKNKKRRQRS